MTGSCGGPRDSRSVSGIELLMEELVEVTVLMEGLMPYAGYTPVIAAVWDTHAAGSIGRIGSPVELNVGYAVRVGDLNLARVTNTGAEACIVFELKRNTHSWAERSSSGGLGPSTWPQSE